MNKYLSGPHSGEHYVGSFGHYNYYEDEEGDVRYEYDENSFDSEEDREDYEEMEGDELTKD